MMPLTGKRVFYVEDDVNNRAIVQTILELEGAKVGFERWGVIETVIARMEAFQPDIILLDLMFPANINGGYDIYDALRQYPFFADTPIVAVSASDPSIEIPKTRAKGFAGFIGKPIKLRHFPTQIASVINGQSIWVDS